MAYSVHLVPLGIDLNLTLDDLGHPECPNLWDRLYPAKYKRGDLICMQCLEDNPGCPEAMWLRVTDGRRHAGHYNTAIRDHPEPESDRHLALKEREASAAIKAGFKAEIESRAKGVRPDVLITGANGFQLGFEAQLSAIAPHQVRRRTKAAWTAGITSMWTTDDPYAAPIDRAPWARIGNHPWIDIASGVALPVQGGMRGIEMVRCDPRAFVCPDKKAKRPCRGWHPQAVPQQRLLDDLVVQAAAQVVVPLLYKSSPTSRTGSWYWVPAPDAERYRHHIGERIDEDLARAMDDAESAETRPAVPQPLDPSCRYGSSWTPAVQRGPRDTGVVELGMSVGADAVLGGSAGVNCWSVCGCGRRLMSPISQERGYCQACADQRGEPIPGGRP